MASLSFGLLAGCGSQVIPGVIEEGTTATIAIPDDFDVGYGTVKASDPNGSPGTYDPFRTDGLVEDLQRGELIFKLYDGATFKTNLPVRYITRVARDPASAIPDGEHVQPIAFIDIPYDIVDEDEGLNSDGRKVFEIKVERQRRNPANSFNFEKVEQSYWADSSPSVDWWGWGSQDGGAGSQQQTIPITIIDSPIPDIDEPTTTADNYTPLEAWGPNGARGGSGGTIQKGLLTTLELRNAVPRPEFRLQIPAAQVAPYAWKAKVDYPSSRMKVINVRLIRGDPGGGIAIWTAPDPAPSSDCPDAATGTVEINVVDPTPHDSLRARGVAVVFELANQDTSACQERIEASDVSIVAGSHTAYDADGNAISFSPISILDYDLH